MSSYRARITWTRDPADLGRAISEYGDRVVYSTLVSHLQTQARLIEDQMKREAPWQNRTGEARRKLSATVEVDGQRVNLYLSHGAAHGVFLELSNGGRYAIVGPTTMKSGPALMRSLQGLMERTPASKVTGWQAW